ncbi:hypothetical protein [Brevibacillus borstelensis]|uniref:hypothetical protein n=1 Tax=Brevibacillus borstelensis TaxID=45462 RepID=UPI0021004533|nr:hypothetical protein [Brevibacillus borstelensis]MED1882366.1 hypothetical protein [Brevibacillus borstelensis]
MMQAGRELDLKVAQALGWKVSEGDGIFCDEDGHVIDEPKFSTTWEGMGVLVEEARKQDIYIDILPQLNCYICEAKAATDRVIGYSTQQEAPYAVCLAYLDAHGISV